MLPSSQSGVGRWTWKSMARVFTGTGLRCCRAPLVPLGQTTPNGSGIMNSTQATATGERADLLAALGERRYFLRYTVRDLTEDQARQRPTASSLTLGGLIKHVTATERQWASFMVDGPSAMGG